jgi:hypothetical protein
VQFLYPVVKFIPAIWLAAFCVFIEKLISSKLIKECSASYWIQKFITVFTKASYGILPWATRIQPTSSAHRYMIHFNIILSRPRFFKWLLRLKFNLCVVYYRIFRKIPCLKWMVYLQFYLVQKCMVREKLTFLRFCVHVVFAQTCMIQDHPSSWTHYERTTLLSSLCVPNATCDGFSNSFQFHMQNSMEGGTRHTLFEVNVKEIFARIHDQGSWWP